MQDVKGAFHRSQSHHLRTIAVAVAVAVAVVAAFAAAAAVVVVVAVAEERRLARMKEGVNERALQAAEERALSRTTCVGRLRRVAGVLTGVAWFVGETGRRHQDQER